MTKRPKLTAAAILGFVLGVAAVAFGREPDKLDFHHGERPNPKARSHRWESDNDHRLQSKFAIVWTAAPKGFWPQVQTKHRDKYTGLTHEVWRRLPQAKASKTWEDAEKQIKEYREREYRKRGI